MRLLLAEDEGELSNALSVILRHNHYSVDVVDNGADALDYALAGQYDGLILDILMPGLDGIQVLKKLRERGITTPALFLTAKAEVDDRIKGLDTGADDYITKPFDMGELMARWRAMTRPGRNLYPGCASIRQPLSGPEHLRNVGGRAAHPAGQQGIPDAGNAHHKSPAVDLHRPVSGENLGLGGGGGKPGGVGLYIRTAEKARFSGGAGGDPGRTGRGLRIGGTRMIKKLRRKFVLIAMLSLFLVMLVVLGSVNAVNLYQINRKADSLLTLLTDNNGKFPDLLPSGEPEPPHKRPGGGLDCRRKPGLKPGILW